MPATRRSGWGVSASAVVAGVLLSLALIAPSAAEGAAIRYAAPTPAGTQDCSSPANACSLMKATTDVAVADGDEVILAPGEYTVGEAIEVSKAIDIHGQGAPSATRIVANPAPANSGVVLNKAGTKLHDLQIEYTGVFSALFASEGTVDRVVVISSSTAGCGLSNATLLDAICVSKGAGGAGLNVNWSGGTHANVLRNVTAIGAGTNGVGLLSTASSGATISIDAKNVIARGSGTGDDVHSLADKTSSTTVALDHSNYFKVFSFAQEGGTSTVTEPTTNGNQTEAPTFVNPALGDYHQAAGSKTIDAGVADASNGALDVDGTARTQGTAIDIGADEYTPPSPLSPPEIVPLPDTVAPLTSIARHPAKSVRTRRKAIKVTFRFGSDDPAAHYECALDSKPFAPCASPRTLAVKRGRHSFRVRGIDPAGNVDKTPAAFAWTVKRKPPPNR
jgi:hypothetical protein